MVELAVVFASLSLHGNKVKTLDELEAKEVAFNYENGLLLLLNAADLQMDVQALFLFDDTVPFDDSLLKRFKQLELFEVPCYAASCHDEITTSDLNELLSDKLPFIKAISYDSLYERIADSEHVFWV